MFKYLIYIAINGYFDFLGFYILLTILHFDSNLLINNIFLNFIVTEIIYFAALSLLVFLYKIIKLKKVHEISLLIFGCHLLNLLVPFHFYKYY